MTEFFPEKPFQIIAYNRRNAIVFTFTSYEASKALYYITWELPINGIHALTYLT
jgi:hypothetical protein